MAELVVLGPFSSSAKLSGARIKELYFIYFTKFTKGFLPSISVTVLRYENVSYWHVIGTSPWMVGDRITAQSRMLWWGSMLGPENCNLKQGMPAHRKYCKYGLMRTGLVRAVPVMNKSHARTCYHEQESGRNGGCMQDWNILYWKICDRKMWFVQEEGIFTYSSSKILALYMWVNEAQIMGTSRTV